MKLHSFFVKRGDIVVIVFVFVVDVDVVFRLAFASLHNNNNNNNNNIIIITITYYDTLHYIVLERCDACKYIYSSNSLSFLFSPACLLACFPCNITYLFPSCLLLCLSPPYFNRIRSDAAHACLCVCALMPSGRHLQ